jgi:hypothetical protein
MVVNKKCEKMNKVNVSKADLGLLLENNLNCSLNERITGPEVERISRGEHKDGVRVGEEKRVKVEAEVECIMV